MPADARLAVRMSGICKAFDGVVVLEDVEIGRAHV